VISSNTAQWKLALHRSTRWGFASRRKLALNQPAHAILPALSVLCERIVPLSLGNACQGSVEHLTLITTVREGIYPHTLQVDPDDIPNCIKAVQVCMHAVTRRLGPGHHLMT